MFIHFLPMQHGDFPVRKLWKITRGQSFRNDHSIIRIYQNIISIVLPMFNAQLLYTHSIPILLDIYIPIIYPLYICIYTYHYISNSLQCSMVPHLPPVRCASGTRNAPPFTASSTACEDSSREASQATALSLGRASLAPKMVEKWGIYVPSGNLT